MTISSVFLLLIAGGVVRSTGSGMGCPDWPKCYGAWFPPTCSCELPADYRETFLNKRLEKAKRFASMLKSAGMNAQADKLLNDPALKIPEEFNPRKAWTEYINRIIGVLSGLFSLVFFLSLMKIRRHVSRLKFAAGVAGFLMMLFNAWFGSIVVATNLFPVMISIHYLAAYAVLALFMFSIVNARIDADNRALLSYKWFYTLFVLMSLVQIVYGTRLREVSEKALYNGTLYVESNGGAPDFEVLGNVFDVHWFTAIALIVISALPVLLLRKKLNARWYRLVISVPLVLGVQYLSGVLNLRMGFPLTAQVSHIFFAGVVFGITLYICIAVFRAPKNIPGI